VSDTSRTREEDAIALRVRALRVDPPSEPFASRLHQRLVAAGPPPAPIHRLRGWLRARPHVTWPAAGVLAGAGTFALLMWLAGTPPARVATSPAPTAALTGESTYRVPASKVALVRLNFAAEVVVDGVTFDVELPEGLAFWSRGKSLPERRFRWAGRLEAGDNWIPIAIKAERPGRYRVLARVHAGEQVLENQVVLEVGSGA
jgi:hypothetical protein